MKHKKGDLILVDFPFTDFSGEKRRPALIIGVSGDHVVIAFITTRRIDNSHWFLSIEPTPKNGLLAKSFVRCDKILSLDIKLAQNALGNTSKTITDKVDVKIRKLLKI